MLHHLGPITEYDRGRNWLLSFTVSPVSWSLSPPEIPIPAQPLHKDAGLVLIRGLWARPVGAIDKLHAPALSFILSDDRTPTARVTSTCLEQAKPLFVFEEPPVSPQCGQLPMG